MANVYYRKINFPQHTLKTNDGSLLFIIGALLLLSLLLRVSYEIVYWLRLRFECTTNSFRLREFLNRVAVHLVSTWRPIGVQFWICIFLLRFGTRRLTMYFGRWIQYKIFYYKQIASCYFEHFYIFKRYF